MIFSIIFFFFTPYNSINISNNIRALTFSHCTLFFSIFPLFLCFARENVNIFIRCVFFAIFESSLFARKFVCTLSNWSRIQTIPYYTLYTCICAHTALELIDVIFPVPQLLSHKEWFLLYFVLYPRFFFFSFFSIHSN